MRTTISIDDYLLEGAKRRARERGQTLGELVEDALRLELEEGKPVEAVEVPVFTGGSGVRPGVDLGSNRALREALDEGAPVERLR